MLFKKLLSSRIMITAKANTIFILNEFILQEVIKL